MSVTWLENKSAREVKLFLNRCKSRLFLGLESHDHSFNSEDRKCDCEGLEGYNLNVTIFQNSYQKERELSSLFVKPTLSVSLFILTYVYNCICGIVFLYVFMSLSSEKLSLKLGKKITCSAILTVAQALPFCNKQCPLQLTPLSPPLYNSIIQDRTCQELDGVSIAKDLRSS